MTGANFAHANFTPCQQSHAFEDRRIPVSSEEPVKIGRAVAKLRPCTDNAIFDCKVLSRNHAAIWFEDGKFYLKDTKSSNGTFVNNQRLSKGSEESAPKEIFSGDIIQFGVEIVESAKKVTHGCIICMARLYYPDGKEAPSRSEFDTVYSQASSMPVASHCLQVSECSAAVSSQELYQLQQYIKEAVYREQLIESKLAALQNLLNCTQDASENSWRALIDEDRLLSRIEMLEGQLQVFAKNITEDKLREQIFQLQEEKERYELAGKEALRRALQEKLEAMQRLSDVERSLETTEEECSHLRESCQAANKEIQNFSQQHNDVLQQLKSLGQQYEETESNYKLLREKCFINVPPFEDFDDAQNQNPLTSSDSSNENAFAQDSPRKRKTSSPRKSSRRTLVPFGIEKEAVSSDEEKDVLTQKERKAAVPQKMKKFDSDQNSLQMAMTELNQTRDRADKLNRDLNQAQKQLVDNEKRAASLQECLCLFNERLHILMEQASSDMIMQLDDAMYQKYKNDDFINFLRESVINLERKVSILFPKEAFSGKQNNLLQLEAASAEAGVAMLNGHHFVQEHYNANDDLANHQNPDNTKNFMLQMTKALAAQEKAENEVLIHKENMKKVQDLFETSNEEAESTIKVHKDLLNDATVRVKLLERQMEEKETTLQLLQNEINTLRFGIGNSLIKSEEQIMEKAIKLEETPQNTVNSALHRQIDRNASEFAALKEECSSLKSHIAAIEFEIKNSKKENLRLNGEQAKLEEKFYSTEEKRKKLEDEIFERNGRLEINQAESSVLRTKLNEALAELNRLKMSSQTANENIVSRAEAFEISQHNENDVIDEEDTLSWHDISMQAQTVTLCSVIPLLFLLLAVVMAFLPSLSNWTATNEDVPPAD